MNKWDIEWNSRIEQRQTIIIKDKLYEGLKEEYFGIDCKQKRQNHLSLAESIKFVYWIGSEWVFNITCM